MSDDEIPELLEVDSTNEAGPSRVRDRRKVPITLLTGYLGAGKSTLLEYILTADHGYKIAVCMNDFGDTTDIEAKTLTLTDPVTKEQTSQFLSLPNGCLCCSFKDMGIAAIEEMAHQQDVDWVMVELTGLADPAPIAKSFWENEEMGDLMLDGVVCVVDCRNITKQLEEQRQDGSINDAQKQAACADIILLNKTDLVSGDQLKTVTELIKAINPTLKIYQTVRSRAPLKEMFNIRAFSDHDYTSIGSGQSNNAVRQHTNEERSQALSQVSEHHHDHDEDDHHHLENKKSKHYSGISTIMIPLPVLSHNQHDRLNNFLETLLWTSTLPDKPREVTSQDQIEILRTKGYVQVEGGAEYVLQGVTDIFEFHKLQPSGNDSKVEGRNEGEMKGKIVFIGKGVTDEIKQSLLDYLDVRI